MLRCGSEALQSATLPTQELQRNLRSSAQFQSVPFAQFLWQSVDSAGRCSLAQISVPGKVLQTVCNLTNCALSIMPGRGGGRGAAGRGKGKGKGRCKNVPQGRGKGIVANDSKCKVYGARKVTFARILKVQNTSSLCDHHLKKLHELLHEWKLMESATADSASVSKKYRNFNYSQCRVPWAQCQQVEPFQAVQRLCHGPWVGHTGPHLTRDCLQ